MPAKKAVKRDDTAKTADLDAMQRSITKLKANRADLKAGTGTNVQRIARCEDALVDLTRAFLVMTGVAGTDDRA